MSKVAYNPDSATLGIDTSFHKVKNLVEVSFDSNHKVSTAILANGMKIYKPHVSRKKSLSLNYYSIVYNKG